MSSSSLIYSTAAGCDSFLEIRGTRVEGSGSMTLSLEELDFEACVGDLTGGFLFFLAGSLDVLVELALCALLAHFPPPFPISRNYRSFWIFNLSKLLRYPRDKFSAQL